MLQRSSRFLLICVVMFALIAIAQPAAANEAQQGIITSTPMADGAIVHFVADGETLAGIAEAYGVSMDEIRGLNGLAPDSSSIFPDQKLIIRLAPTVTVTPTITPVTPRPTRSPTPVTPTGTPAPSRTPAPTLTPTPTINPLVSAATGFVDSYRRPLLIGMIALCAVGLAWTVWTGFARK
jgi:hypothetical protein